jgi:hypothetical protein
LAPAAAEAELPRRDHLELPATIALALGGGIAGYVVMSIDGLGPHKLSETGEFRLWLFLISTQTALWSLGAAVLVGLLRSSPLADVASPARRKVSWAVGSTAVPIVGFVVAASLRSKLEYPIPHHQAKVIVVSLLGAAVALVGVAALARIDFALRHETFEPTKEGVDAYLRLHAVLQRVLAVEGAILGAAILASGALRNAVVAYHDHDNASFPREFVLLYGTYFTLVLAVLYAPVYRRLLETGRRLVEAAFPAEEPTSPDWPTVYDRRKKLEELLQLQIATSTSFRAGLAITAPLASSIVGLLLGAA